MTDSSRANADALNRAGIESVNAGRHDEACEHFLKAAAADPTFASPLNNLGYVLNSLGRHAEALPHLERAVLLAPALADAHNNLGAALAGLSHGDTAMSAYARALQLDPKSAAAHNNIAIEFAARGDNSRAAQHYGEALRLDPHFAAAYSNLGALLQRTGSLADATQCLLRAVHLKPDMADAYVTLGVIYADTRRPIEAIDAFSKALTIDPSLSLARAQRLHQQGRICDWRAVHAQLEAMPSLGIDGGATPPWAMLSFEDAPSKQLARARNFANERYGAVEAAPIARARRDKLRIGYFSGDFHNHAVMHLIARAFELHDRSRFEIEAFSFGRDTSDDMRRRIRAGVDRFHECRTLSDGAVTTLAREREIDIAVNLSGYTQGARTGVFARRAAPVQINYLGYPGTMGAPFMDFILVDSVIAPFGSESGYSEQIIRLPHCYQANDDTRDIAIAPARAALGLPELGFVFCCFNNAYKITPDEFQIWMRLLMQIEGSVLWLLAANEWAEANLKRSAAMAGLDASRLVFAPFASPTEHLARCQRADLFLDTFNYNAHTSASDALWAGVPILTKCGRSFAARVCASLLMTVGLPELITSSESEYETRALHLARHPEELSKLRARLAVNRTSSPLFDSAGFTRDLEAAFEFAQARGAGASGGN